MSENIPTPCNLRILIAVDESDRFLRAIDYVGMLLGGQSEVRIVLLSILAIPSEDLFESADARDRWVRERRLVSEKHLEDCEVRLRAAGFESAQISKRLLVQDCPSIADCILKEQERLGCRTVVITRRGISKKEEFMFGSTSNRILHKARACAVWVIESDGSEEGETL